MYRMEDEHEAHLQSIKDKFCSLVDQKYRKGQREHGGRLWLRSDLKKEALMEVIDLAVYMLTLMEKENEGPESQECSAQTAQVPN